MKTTLRIMSALLAIACVLSLVAAGTNIQDILDTKEYWEEVREEGLDSFDMLEDGINQLADNEDAYLEGYETYQKGLKDYEAGVKQIEEGEIALEEGRATLAAGQATYNSGAAQLAAGHQTYDENVAKLNAAKEQLAAGEAQLAAGKAELEAGKAELAANEAAYNEGKVKLAAATPIYNTVMPIYQANQQLQASYDAAVASGNTIEAGLLKIQLDQSNALLSASLGGYSIPGIISEYESGQAQIALYEAGQAKVAEGEQTIAAGEQKIAESRAKIAEAEAKLADAKALLDQKDGELAAGGAKLAAGRAELAEGEKTLEEGKATLAEGAIALEAGKSQLALYEDGEEQVADGIDQALSQETYYDKDNNPLVESIEDRVGGKKYDCWISEISNATGENLKRLDLDKCMDVVDAGRDFIDDTTVVVTDELTGRVLGIIITATAAVIGLIAAVIGLFGKRLGTGIVGLIASIAAVAGTVFVFAKEATQYPMSKIAESAGTGFIPAAVTVLAVVAFATTVVAFVAKAVGKKTAAAV